MYSCILYFFGVFSSLSNHQPDPRPPHLRYDDNTIRRHLRLGPVLEPDLRKWREEREREKVHTEKRERKRDAASSHLPRSVDPRRPDALQFPVASDHPFAWSLLRPPRDAMHLGQCAATAIRPEPSSSSTMCLCASASPFKSSQTRLSSCTNHGPPSLDRGEW